MDYCGLSWFNNIRALANVSIGQLVYMFIAICCENIVEEGEEEEVVKTNVKNGSAALKCLVLRYTNRGMWFRTHWGCTVNTCAYFQLMTQVRLHRQSKLCTVFGQENVCFRTYLLFSIWCCCIISRLSNECRWVMQQQECLLGVFQRYCYLGDDRK